MCLCVSSSYKAASHVGLGTPLLSNMTSCQLITSAETIFPNKALSQVFSNRTLIFLEDTIHPTIGGKADCIKYLCISIVSIMLLLFIGQHKGTGGRHGRDSKRREARKPGRPLAILAEEVWWKQRPSMGLGGVAILSQLQSVGQVCP